MGGRDARRRRKGGVDADRFRVRPDARVRRRGKSCAQSRAGRGKSCPEPVVEKNLLVPQRIALTDSDGHRVAGAAQPAAPLPRAPCRRPRASRKLRSIRAGVTSRTMRTLVIARAPRLVVARELDVGDRHAERLAVGKPAAGALLDVPPDLREVEIARGIGLGVPVPHVGEVLRVDVDDLDARRGIGRDSGANVAHGNPSSATNWHGFMRFLRSSLRRSAGQQATA